MTLKERFRQFKAWQNHAFDYSFDEHEQHTCVNCGNTFAGNYCPYCSQKAGVGKITWSSVIKGALEVWGMHSRSLPYTLLQVMFRPGHMISDYINGKRQVSFPPVKMLLILGVISVVVDHFFVIKDAFTEETASIISSEWQFLRGYAKWLEANPGWGWLSVTSHFLFPAWAIFAYAPKNSNHTLPQGFFIQVFMSMQVLIIDDIADMLNDYFYFLVPLGYIYTNRHLFGYSYWGSIWRSLAVIGCGLSLALSGAYLYHYFISAKGHQPSEHVLGYFSLLLSVVVAIIIFMLISKWSAARNEQAKNTALAKEATANLEQEPESEND